MGYQLIETIEVGAGGAASIEFTAIPQDGVDLQVVCSFRSSLSYSELNMTCRLNGNTGTNYAFKVLKGTGSAVSSAGSASDDNINQRNLTTTALDTTNTFSNASIYLSNYAIVAPTSVSSDIVTENNATAAFQNIIAGLYSNSEAITSIELAGVTLAQYSTASLYKITAD